MVNMRMTDYILLSSNQKILGIIILILFVIIAAIIFLIFYVITVATQTNIAKKRAYKEDLQTRGITIHTTFRHIFGLPILENSTCEIFSYADKIEFKSGTTIVSLARDKITDMAIKTYTQVQNHLVSSAGDAIAGAMAWGSIGASIGGRVKNVKVQTSTKYLFITYADNQKRIAYICLDITAYPSKVPNHFAYQLVREFKKLNTTSGIQIEL